MISTYRYAGQRAVEKDGQKSAIPPAGEKTRYFLGEEKVHGRGRDTAEHVELVDEDGLGFVIETLGFGVDMNRELLPGVGGEASPRREEPCLSLPKPFSIVAADPRT